jgi:hypothetical protein
MAGSGTTSTSAAADPGLAKPAMTTTAVAMATLHVDHVRNLMSGGVIEISALLGRYGLCQKHDNDTNLGKS